MKNQFEGQPSMEEVTKAEESMKEEQRDKSEGREQTFNAGYKVAMKGENEREKEKQLQEIYRALKLYEGEEVQILTGCFSESNCNSATFGKIIDVTLTEVKLKQDGWANHWYRDSIISINLADIDGIRKAMKVKEQVGSITSYNYKSGEMVFLNKSISDKEVLKKMYDENDPRLDRGKYEKSIHKLP